MRLQLAAPDRNGALLPGAKTAWGGVYRGAAALLWLGYEEPGKEVLGQEFSAHPPQPPSLEKRPSPRDETDTQTDTGQRGASLGPWRTLRSRSLAACRHLRCSERMKNQVPATCDEECPELSLSAQIDERGASS